MAITLNGTTGIANVDGSAASPAFRNTDANSGVSGSADQVVISTAGSERLRLASAGQLGIGGANYGTDGQVLTSTGASSAPAWEAAAGGKILQVKHFMEFAHRSTTSNTFVSIGGAAGVTITPTVSTSNILVFARGCSSSQTANRGGCLTIYRSVDSGTYADMRTDGNNGGLISVQSVSVNDIVGWTICVEDDHGTTDSIQYKIYFRSNNTDNSFQTGRAAGGSNGTTSLTALEFEP